MHTCILTNYRSTLEYVVSFNRRPWLSPISAIRYYSVARYCNYRKGRLHRCTWDTAVNAFQNFHLISYLLIEGKFSKMLTVKSSDVQIVSQRFSVQQSNMYRGWMWSHWISQRAHLGGAVEVNVTFYLVETFTSVSVQRPVVMRAVEVEIGTTLRELLM